MCIRDRKQYIYHSPYRGFMSTMDDRDHFGLGRVKRVDSLEVIWPDGRYQLLTGLNVDRLLVVKQADATEKRRAKPSPPARDHLFEPEEKAWLVSSLSRRPVSRPGADRR